MSVDPNVALHAVEKAIAAGGPALAAAVPVTAPVVLPATAAALWLAERADDEDVPEALAAAIKEWRDGDHNAQEDITAGVVLASKLLDMLPFIPKEVTEAIRRDASSVVEHFLAVLKKPAARQNEDGRVAAKKALRKVASTRRVIPPPGVSLNPYIPAPIRNLRPPPLPVLPGARPPRDGHTIGDGAIGGGTSPIPEVPTVKQPAEIPPVVVTPPVVVAPGVGSPSGVPWVGNLRQQEQIHFDGISRPGCDVGAVLSAVEDYAHMTAAQRRPPAIMLTIDDLVTIAAHDARWCSRIEEIVGIGNVIAREAHVLDRNSSAGNPDTWQQAIDKLMELDCSPPDIVGSCLSPDVYAPHTPGVILGVAPIGHRGQDDEVSSITPTSWGGVVITSSIVNSNARRVGLARDIAAGIVPGAFELMAVNACDPRTGGTPYLATPAMQPTASNPDHGVQPAKPIEDDWATTKATIDAQGNGAIVMWTTIREGVSAACASPLWTASGIAYPVAKS